MIRRGELWWGDLGEPGEGSAPAGRRPLLVVQADAYNRTRLGTVVVVAITSNVRVAAYPFNVLLPAGLSGLSRDSVVNVTALFTLDRFDLVERIGLLPPWTMQDVESGVRTVLGL